MTDHHDHGDHGDATLDVIALLEATIKEDGHALDVLHDSVMASPHLGHIVSTLAGVLASELCGHYGSDGALEYLAHQRGHELGSHDCSSEASEHSHGAEDLDPADRIGFEVSEVGDKLADLASKTEDGLGDIVTAAEQNGEELARLVNAVERLGDILDKRLA